MVMQKDPHAWDSEVPGSIPPHHHKPSLTNALVRKKGGGEDDLLLREVPEQHSSTYSVGDQTQPLTFVTPSLYSLHHLSDCPSQFKTHSSLSYFVTLCGCVISFFLRSGSLLESANL